MGLKVELLEKSFTAIAPQGDELNNRFYHNLFTDFPEVLPLFTDVNMAEQKKKLLASLKMAVENLRRTEILVPALENLGLQHVDYGAREEHYAPVGQTLLKSLSEVAGDAWTEELNEAYGEIAKIMLAGATQTIGSHHA